MTGPATPGETVGGAVGRRRSLWPLWTMIAVFAAPIVATWFYFFFPEYLPETRSNRGEILKPAVTLPEGLDLTSMDGEPFDPASLEGAWTLVYLTAGSCDQACIEHLMQIRQIRLGLGEGRKLVERLLLIGDPSVPLDQALMDDAFDGDGGGPDRRGRARAPCSAPWGQARRDWAVSICWTPKDGSRCATRRMPRRKTY